MKKAKDYIIFPLDLPSIEAAKSYITILSEYVGMFKVGLELFIQSGPEIIHLIHKTGNAKIFLDLKLHDIPATVSRAMARIADLGVTFATVHCGESQDMLDAAVYGSQGRVGVLGVTVLTSISQDDIVSAGFKQELALDMSKLVMKRAAAAQNAGCAGIVCSGLEVEIIKQNFGKEFITVTPGIRPLLEGAEKDDQHRVSTPSQAIQKGSDYLVIGRPIRDAKDPQAVAISIAEEIETVLTR